MLPDVWSMADRRLRPRPRGDSSPASTHGPVGDLLRGVDHHLWVDDWFHRHPVLAQGERALADDLHPVGVRHLPLFAHIGWELCLDGALLLRDGLETHLEPLRHALAETRGASLDAALAHHVESPRRDASTRVVELLDRIAEGPWPAGYADADGLVGRLEGVRRRVGVDPLPAIARPRVVAAFAAALERADRALPELLATRPRP
ncbi:MAG: hypothetical protein AAGC60_14080 [Acidobacteriota bacterium]